MNIPDRTSAILAAQRIQEILSASRLVWSNQMPTHEGFYFVREHKGDDVTVVRVRMDYSEQPPQLVVQEGHPANQGVEYLSTYAGSQWAGPIEMPPKA